MNLLFTVLMVALSMALRDGLGTLLTVAEAKGLAHRAGMLDACYDVAQTVSYVFGAGEIVLHGWDWRSAVILAVMCVTSYVTTRASTAWARRWA